MIDAARSPDTAFDEGAAPGCVVACAAFAACTAHAAAIPVTTIVALIAALIVATVGHPRRAWIMATIPCKAKR
ncbi:protein of unknown function (plasmid) [Pararobbsia alpina]